MEYIVKNIAAYLTILYRIHLSQESVQYVWKFSLV